MSLARSPEFVLLPARLLCSERSHPECVLSLCPESGFRCCQLRKPHRVEIRTGDGRALSDPRRTTIWRAPKHFAIHERFPASDIHKADPALPERFSDAA